MTLEATVTCPGCRADQDSGAAALGALGNLIHYRCIYCGADFSHEVQGLMAAEEGDTLHRNTRSDEEDEERNDALANFEAQLDMLVADGLAEADRIGGYFRGPGIKGELYDLLKDAARKMETKRRTT